MPTKKYLAIAAAVAATTLVAACGASGGGDSKSMTFVSYGKGTYQDGQEKAWLKPYEAKSGTKMVIDGPSDNAKMQAMVEAKNVTWDVMDTDTITARTQCGKLLEKIDIGNSLAGSFPKGTLSECGVPDALFGDLMMYNSKTYKGNAPTSLADFFDTKKFPGKRVIFGSDPTIGNLEAANLADGVTPDQLYPLDVDRSLKVFDRIKSDLTIADTYAQQQQIMVGDQADMALVVSARAYSVLSSGGDFWKPVWDKVPVTWDVLVVPKGSKHKAEAEKFIQFASQPEQAGNFAKYSGAGPANVSAKPSLNALQQQVNVFGDEHKDAQVYIDAAWWAKNQASVVEQWTKWKTG